MAFQSISCFQLNKNIITNEELDIRIQELKNLYMPIDLNKEYHHLKKKAVKKLDAVLKSTTREALQASDLQEILYCSLTAIYYFGMHLKLFASGYKKRISKRNFTKAELLFQKTMNLILPETTDQSIKMAFTFITRVELWPYESFVGQILGVMMHFSRAHITLYNDLLTDMILFTDVEMSRHRMRLLYELLKNENWTVNRKKLLPFITRLLNCFAYSISTDNEKSNIYSQLQNGFDVCLRRIFEKVDNDYRLTIIILMLNWFSNVTLIDANILEFSNLLNYAAQLHKASLYKLSFSQHLFEDILNQLVVSERHLYSLMGSRLLQSLLDRQSNAIYLSSPAIFYEFSQMNLRTGKYESDDKAFILQHRELLHDSILKSLMKHCDRLSNQKALYAIICCIVVEVPCGMTAAAAACLVMAIQEYALTGRNLSPYCRYWMHAAVVSVMSLICWVHKAPVLYRYVNEIFSRRSKEAPQLNPPLMHDYTITHHHVTWNKPTLFFEDWEVRYGLWKQFQDSHSNGRSVKKLPG